MIRRLKGEQEKRQRYGAAEDGREQRYVKPDEITQPIRSAPAYVEPSAEQKTPRLRVKTDATWPTAFSAGISRKKLDLALLVIMAAVAVIITIIRSLSVGIVGDEAMTYQRSVSASFVTIISQRGIPEPDNNHILYSIIAKFMVLLFGNTEWTLRTPSVMAFILYCNAIGLVLSRYLTGVRLYLFFALAIFNPAILEMMSVGRGYGLAMAFCVSGMYCLMRGVAAGPVHQPRWGTAATLCMAAATLSSLTHILFLGIALAVIGTVELHALLETNAMPPLRDLVYRLHRALVGPAVICLLLAPVLLVQIRALARQGAFGIEGKVSFYHDTVLETVRYSLGGLPVPAWFLGGLGIAAYAIPLIGVLAVVACATIYADKKCDLAEARDLAILLAMLLGASVITIVQHHLAGVAGHRVSYLAGRRALSFVPLFSLVCGLLFALGSRTTLPLVGLVRPVLAVFAVVLLGLFGRSLNFKQTITWPYDNDTKTMMADVKTLLQGWKHEAPARMGASWFLTPSINYYRELDQMRQLAPVTWAGPVGSYDFYFVRPDKILGPCTCNSTDVEVDPVYSAEVTLAELQDKIGPLKIIKRYPLTGTVLATRP